MLHLTDGAGGRDAEEVLAALARRDPSAQASGRQKGLFIAMWSFAEAPEVRKPSTLANLNPRPSTPNPQREYPIPRLQLLLAAVSWLDSGSLR